MTAAPPTGPRPVAARSWGGTPLAAPLQAEPDALVVGLGSTAADVAGLIGIATKVAVAVPRDVVFSAVLQARGGGGPEVMAGFGPGDLMVMAEGALVVFQYAGSASSHRHADFTPTYWAGLRERPGAEGSARSRQASYLSVPRRPAPTT